MYFETQKLLRKFQVQKLYVRYSEISQKKNNLFTSFIFFKNTRRGNRNFVKQVRNEG